MLNEPTFEYFLLGSRPDLRFTDHPRISKIISIGPLTTDWRYLLIKRNV